MKRAKKMIEYLDASIIVKWFKKDEPKITEALNILESIKNLEGNYMTSEWSLLEVTRALSKAAYKEEVISEDYISLKDLAGVGAINLIPVSQNLDLAHKITVQMKLYASDSIHLATAIQNNCNILISEDQHHHKKKLKEYLKKFDIKVKKL
ncbi:MAG: PIN domain-containing protein [Candidatus Altiarchaeales archaeon]|nr:PIN domain-containing protein [Candidatus Altiarchaeales archaeon]